MHGCSLSCLQARTLQLSCMESITQDLLGVKSPIKSSHDQRQWKAVKCAGQEEEVHTWHGAELEVRWRACERCGLL